MRLCDYGLLLCACLVFLMCHVRESIVQFTAEIALPASDANTTLSRRILYLPGFSEWGLESSATFRMSNIHLPHAQWACAALLLLRNSVDCALAVDSISISIFCHVCHCVWTSFVSQLATCAKAVSFLLKLTRNFLCLKLLCLWNKTWISIYF